MTPTGIDRIGNTVLIEVGDGISSSTVDELKKVFLEQIQIGCDEFILDCSGIKIIDSMGIGLLVATHNTISAQDGTLILKNVPEDVFKLLTTMRLHQRFTIERSEEGS